MTVDQTTHQAEIARGKRKSALIAFALIFLLLVVGGAGCACLSGSKQVESAEELAEKGMVNAVIDQVYPLEKIQEAHAYVESGRKKGNVVIRV